MKDPPLNSHLQFEIIRSLVAPDDNPGWQNFLTSWGGLSCYNYLLLDRPHNDLQSIVTKLVDLKVKNEAAEFFTPTLQKLSDIHLRSKHILFESNFAKTDIINVYVMISISLVILILACVNFINLVTAKASARAKEIGVRKVMGGLKRQLIGQHLTESFVIVLLSFIISVGITLLLLPLLNQVYHRNADIYLLPWSQILPVTIGFLTILSLFAGTYPAFVLSSFKPTDVLKGTFQSGKVGTSIRKGLVILQFVISIALIAGAGIIYQQMNYINTMDMGYNRDQVVTVRLQGQGMVQQLQVFKDKLLQIPGIEKVGSSTVRLGQRKMTITLPAP